MRYGIFGDIHSNLEAFQKVIEAYSKENIDRYISVGDIVGYGADPQHCIKQLENLNAKTVSGNHDRASVGLLSPDSLNHAAREAVKWTEKVLDSEEKEYLKRLDLVINEEDFSVVHGSLDRPDFFYYIMDTSSAYRCFLKMENNLCFVGHSHSPVIFFMEGDHIEYTFEGFLRILPEVKYIVNVGSVGQPRDGDPRAAFSIFDTSEKTIEIKRVDYDIENAKSKILKAGLPEMLGYRLIEGR